MLMMIRKFSILLLIISSIVPGARKLLAGNTKPVPGKEMITGNQNVDSLKWSVDYLNKLLYSHGEWYLADPSYKKPMQGVLNYAENDPLDTVVVNIRKLLGDEKVVYLMERRPQDIRNVKEIIGYISDEEIRTGIEAIKMRVLDSLNLNNIIVPPGIMETELLKAPQVPNGEPVDLLGSKLKELPSEFVTNMNKRFAAMQFPRDLSDQAMDTVRYELFKSYREFYNDSVMNSWSERVTYSYKSKYIAEQSDLRIKAYKKSVEAKNFALLAAYNDKAVSKANDSLKVALRYLTAHAEADSSLIRLVNLADQKTTIWTANHGMKPIRMFLKNAQNDSLSVVLINNGKGEIKLVIDDAIKLTRFEESQNRSIKFETKAPDKRLKKVELEKIVYPPWTLRGNGSFGFTQTSLSNWAKGGESSMALLMMSKYDANYSKDKVKWENFGEFRYGITRTKTRGLEKNEDKIEFQSRFGYSAFKKWYYSAEGDFRTQVARGYTSGENQKPISAFMSPGYLTMSVGLDYKPNKNFSLFLAPFTSKTTYVNDTALIDPTAYGLEPGTKKLWEPGLIVKANWRQELSENITYETKGEFFNNYRYTFQKCSFEWEQVLTMRVNRMINARIMTELIYDYNTKFPILDYSGKEIGRKPRWQFKELLTIGLSYKF
jgi:hypothetical protein